MVLFNYSTRELTAKIVYYGPGLCGKTTNLQHVYEQLPEVVKGKMLSLATKTDRTLFFDFLPMDLGEIRGMKTRVQLYTVPGQVFYNETRKLVLKGADGVVFVADSQEAMMSSNIESLRNLEENLKAHGMRLSEIPHVFQFNKRDLPRLSSVEELNAALNRYNAPGFEAVATTGLGVQDTLKGIAKLVLLHLTRRYQSKSGAAAEKAPAAVAQQIPAPELVSSFAPPRAAAAARVDVPMEAPVARPAPVTRSSVRAEPPQAPSVSGPPSPLFLGGSAPAPAREPAVSSFGEPEVDAVVGGLRESAESASFGTAGKEWKGSASGQPGLRDPLPKAEDEGYYLGDPDAASDVDTSEYSKLTQPSDPFQEPPADAARLTAGETHEIIFPVDLHDGMAVRRFTLSVKLRLDSAD